MIMLFYLLAGHFIADYPLQGDWLAKAKNHKLEPIAGETIWPMALIGHSLIHSLVVYLATASLTLATLELVAHTIIDYTKCSGRIGYNTDQALHIACKVLWFLVFIFVRPF